MPEASEMHNSGRRPSSSSIKSHSLYASTPFKFIVQETAFYLHASLVSRHSRALDRMVNGDMLEAQKGYAVLNEVEEGTFARFAEWAYQGFDTSGEVSHQLLDDSELERNLAEDSGSDKSSQTVGKLPKEGKPLRNLVPAHMRSDWDDESSSANSSRTRLKESFIHRKATV